MSYSIGSLWRIWDLQVQTIIDDGYIELKDYYEEIKASNPDNWEKFVTSVGGEDNALKFDSKLYFNDSSIDINIRCYNYVRTFISFCETFKTDLGCVLLTDHNYNHEILYDKFVEFSKGSNLKIIPGVEINVEGIHILIAFEKPPFSKQSYSEGTKTFLDRIDIHSRKDDDGILTVCSSKAVIDIMKETGDTNFLYIFPHCNSDNGLLQERTKTDRTHLANIFNYHCNIILQSINKKAIDEVIAFIKTKPNLTTNPIPTIASDCRCLKDIAKPDEEGNLMWIKSDPTYNGLKQILIEPNERTFIGDIPPKKEFVEYNKELFVDKITIETSKDDNEWFDKPNEINLNPGLVSIIGKKGSGKSALADIIGMTGNADMRKFSFLDPLKFLSHSSCKKYKASIKLHDNFENTKQFAKPDYVNELTSKVVYLSQYFVQELCEDLSTSRLQDEINRVIFSHIPKEEKPDAEDLDELINMKRKSINNQISIIKEQIVEINKKVEEYELYELPNNLEKLTNKLDEKKRQLVELVKPKDVSEPSKKLPEEVKKQIDLLKTKITTSENEFKKLNSRLEEILLDKKNLNEVIDKLKYIRIVFDNLKKEIEDNEAIVKYTIDVNMLLKLEIDDKVIKDKIIEIEKESETLKLKRGESEKEINASNKELKEINKKLDEEQKEYQKYKESIEKWERKKREIIGDKVTLDTISYFDDKINFIKTIIPSKLNNLRKDRLTKSKKIAELLLTSKDIYPSVYKFSKEYAINQAKHFGINENNFITFDAKLKFVDNVIDLFLELINQQRKGTFQGKDDGKKILQEILMNIKLHSIDEIISLPDKIIEALKVNHTTKEKLDFDSQLLKTRKELYDFIFSLDYIEIKFEIKYADGQITNLSPGEKGTLLLIFYLLIDIDKRPIIIDQPEENLDNETVFLRLVPFIKQVKSERQIIIVTHNPNLAVVCDSEQVIYAHIDKSKNNLITYISGSLENPIIKEKVLNVLEGTKPAFVNRKVKYDI